MDLRGRAATLATMRWVALCLLVILVCGGALVSVPALAVPGPPAMSPVEVSFEPGAAGLQIAVWIEDAAGNYVDTAYVTRLTGQFGLGNRPGAALLKTDFGWPYGRREMVLPVWAHRRNHKYPRVVMGGVCGNSTDSKCPDGSLCGGDCRDDTIAYHPRVSSYEPFYCSPSGKSTLDALSCASKGTFSKGALRPFPDEYSLYPPRADLTGYDPATDSADVQRYASLNDLVAVSQATPPAGQPVDPPVVWYPPASLLPGDYVAFVELSQEADWNDQPRHPNQADGVKEWDFEGHPFLGQPSVVYQVPFHYQPGEAWTAVASQYAGYGSWDGSDGELRPPDGTLSDAPGTGAGRLLDVSDDTDRYRVKVQVVGDCGDASEQPAAVTDLTANATATSMAVRFTVPSSGLRATRYAVRYHEGDDAITDEDFGRALAAPSVALKAGDGPGTELSVTIPGLQAQTRYAVAVRGVGPCGQLAPVASVRSGTNEQKFATLHGCFVATAAWGTPMAGEVDALRRFRDRWLLPNPLGQVFSAGYYSFGPYLARLVAADEHLRALARWLLRPLVEGARAMDEQPREPAR